MKVVIYNDDFATSYGFTEAIKDAVSQGMTTATCIRPNGTAYNYSVKITKGKLKNICTGIHLNLTDGSVYNKSLSNDKGNYKYSFIKYFYLLEIKKDLRLLKEIEKDLDLQFKQVLSSNLKINHVNGQDHIHMIPSIFKLICKLCKRYKISYIRLTKEPFFLLPSFWRNIQPLYNSNLIKHLLLNYFSVRNKAVAQSYDMKFPEAFYGLLHTNHMDLEVIEAALKNAQKKGFKSIEIMGHPAYGNDARDTTYTTPFLKEYVQSNERANETKTFTGKGIVKLLKKHKVIPKTYLELNL